MPSVLDELPPVDEAQAARLVPLSLIEPSPFRKNRQLGDIASLAASIQARGLLQPILVRPWRGRYQIVVGERRLAAVKQLGHSTIAAIVKEMNDDEVVAAQLVADVTHEGIHPLDEAAAYKALRDDHGWSVEHIAKETGRSPSLVRSRLKLNELTPEGWEAYVDDKLAGTTAVMLARIPSPDLQAKATREVLRASTPGAEPMTSQEAAQHIRQHYMLSPIGEKMQPTDLFDCVTLRCRMTASACITRQDARRLVRSTGEKLALHQPCGLGTCEQGKLVRLAVGAAQSTGAVTHVPDGNGRLFKLKTAPAPMKAVEEEQPVPEPKRQEADTDVLAAASAPSLIEIPLAPEPDPGDTVEEEPPDPEAATAQEATPAQHLKKPSRQTQEWMRFTAEQQIEAILDDPSYWVDAVLGVAGKALPFDTEGQKLTALLAAGAKVAATERIARTEYNRLAAEFFERFQKETPPPAKHEWTEDSVFSHDTLKNVRRRLCAKCGTDKTTAGINRKPCPGGKARAA